MESAAFVSGVAPGPIGASKSQYICGHNNNYNVRRFSLSHPIDHGQTIPNIRMGFSSLDMPESASVIRDRDLTEVDTVIKAAIRQVFGNCYISEDEMTNDLGKIISEFKTGELNVREFVRSLAKSNLYRSRFFETSGPVRFIELNCKHLLGRGIIGPEEIKEHVLRLLNEGYDKEIDSYVDSQEYSEMFGDEMVPRFVFKGVYPKNDDFNRMTAIRGAWDGCFTSTRTGSTAPRKKNGIELNMGHNHKVGAFMKIAGGLPAKPVPQKKVSMADAFPKNPNAPVKKRVKIAENLYRVFEIPPMMPKSEPEWKKEMGKAGGKAWNGVWY